MKRIGNVKGKSTRRAIAVVILTSVFLAVISRSVPVSLDTSLPIANFYDRVTGTRSSALYFIGMYLITLSVVPSITRELRSSGVAPYNRVGAALFSVAVACFLIYLCVLMPASTQIGGGRFSMLLLVSARWAVVQGFIYGVIFYCLSIFIGAIFLCLLGNRRANAGHA